MSADEDTELRDLVAQTLETNGVLGKIRAQLRASVFLALEEQETVKNRTPLVNTDLKKFISTKEGRVVTSLVREFLEHFNLEFTLAVFEPESGSNEHYEGRNRLARDLNIIESSESTSQPLLSEVVQRCCGGGPPSRSRKGSGIEDLTSSHILEARQKFQEYDTDRSGTIDKDELRALFMDMFPSFHRNMLDRYVNDEFRAIDKDFSNSIDFEEFLQMYKRLFVLCKSVVSHDVSDVMAASPRGSISSPTSKIPGPLKKPASSHPRKMQPIPEFPQNEADNLVLDLDIDDESSSSDSIEARNKQNLNNNDQSASKASPRSNSPSSPHSKEDSFFDDPIPKNDRSNSLVSDRNKSPGGGGLSSLGDLPSLGGGAGSTEQQKPNKGNNDLEKDIKAIDKKIADLGFDVPDDDYDDDDFESSNVSPFGVTPRSQKSDHNVKSIEEDLDEEIDEEFSVADDLLKSDNSGGDDLTTDRTISPVDQSGHFDYMEDVSLP